MAPKLLLTGATGYIGGSVLDILARSHPEYDISVLLRRVPDHFQERYPNVKIVKGDYESFDVISDAASQANVVVHSGDSDHEPSLQAIIAGLLRRPEPSFLIHLSGTGIVSDWPDDTYLGKLNPKVWSDIDDRDTIASLPDHALHRNTEKILQSTIAEHGDKLKIAIICPPDIYGLGRGPGRTRTVFFALFVEETRKIGAPFYTGEGSNTRSWVHIDDLMSGVYLKLVEAAVEGGGNADWGKEGYYFASSSQEYSQLDVAKATGKILKSRGVVKNEEPTPVSIDQIDSMVPSYPQLPVGKYLFASNSRTRAERARKTLGYEPRGPSLFEVIEQEVEAALK